MEEWLGIRFQEKILARLGVDVVHGLGSIVPRLDRLRSVVTLHYAGPWNFEKPWERFYFNRLTERSVQQADKVIAISEFCRQEAIKSWRVPPEKVVVIHHGGPGPEFKPPLQQEDPWPGIRRPYFLFVGGLIPQKNPVLLADAFGVFKSLHPDWPHRLVFAGREGEEAPRLREACQKWKISDHVVFTGAVDPGSIHRLYQQAEAIVCPSLQEGFAFPVLEAMACGTPVVGVRAGALTETIADAGLLCDPSPESVAEAMALLVREKVLREGLRKKGLDRACQFSWEQTAKKTLAVYERVGRQP